MSTYLHPVLGEITIHPSVRARRLSISVRPGGEVRLTIPRRMSRQEALHFLEEKQEWVLRARQRMAERYRPRVILPPYETRSHHLSLEPSDNDEIRIRVMAETVVVRYPAAWAPEEDRVQKAIHRGIEEAWRIEAKAYLPGRVAELARQNGFRCGNVTIRNTHTRWGSCSVNNDISLSLHLMKLPDPLIDYVILHELCHTRHKNHGSRFHALLDKVCEGGHLILRRQLKNYSTRW